jgi:hypothetical protein
MREDYSFEGCFLAKGMCLRCFESVLARAPSLQEVYWKHSNHHSQLAFKGLEEQICVAFRHLIQGHITLGNWATLLTLN